MLLLLLLLLLHFLVHNSQNQPQGLMQAATDVNDEAAHKAE